ncbi:hypothetical protein BH11MYX4_BH11MYX4_12150 [soil metagenome]
MRPSSFTRMILGLLGALAALPVLSACSAVREGERAQVARQATEPRTGDATAARPAAGIPASVPMLTAGSKTPPASAPAPKDTSRSIGTPPPPARATAN